MSNGNFVVVYEETRSSIDHDIFFGVFIASGTLVAPAGDIDVPGGAGSGREKDPDVAALRDGGFVVVWTDPDGPNDTTRDRHSGIDPVQRRHRRYLQHLGQQDRRESRKVRTSSALADGGFLVTWEDDAANLVLAQRFDATGQKIGIQFTVRRHRHQPVGSAERLLCWPTAALPTPSTTVHSATLT